MSTRFNYLNSFANGSASENCADASFMRGYAADTGTIITVLGAVFLASIIFALGISAIGVIIAIIEVIIVLHKRSEVYPKEMKRFSLI